MVLLTGNVAEDAENLRQEVERDDVSVITAKLTEVESLSMAFQGCRGVFHTSAFVDPAGLSGYTVSPPNENLLPFLTLFTCCLADKCAINDFLHSFFFFFGFM